MAHSIQAVVFDFGGVLTRAPGPDHWDALLAAIGGENGAVRLAALQAAYQQHRDAYDRGALSSREYWGEILLRLGISGEDAMTRRLFELDTGAWTQSRTEVLRWAAELRGAGIRTGILSNMPSEVLTTIEERMSWVEAFSPRVYSCRVGLIKPEAAIYRALLEELAMPPGEILFLDDRWENVEAARRLDLAAEQFVSLEQIQSIARERYALAELYRSAAGKETQA